MRVIAAVGLGYLCIPAARLYWRVWRNCVAGEHPFNDFYALWSVGKLSLTAQIARLYDFDFLTAFRTGLGIGFDPSMGYAHLPYSYPPLSLLFLFPLGFLSYHAAYLLWAAGTFALYAVAVLGRSVGKRWGVAAAILLLLPANVYSVLFGQNGFLSAALLVAGLCLAGSRPILSGLCLSLLSFKPQLAVLVPVALAAAGHWRAFAATALATVLLAALSGAIFGWPLWHDWIISAPQLTADLLTHGQNIWPIVPTVMANLLMSGLSWPWAGGIQLAATVSVMATIWIVFRRATGDMAVAALLSGTFLATPYAFIYDMPIVAAALVLLVRARFRSGTRFSPTEMALLAAAVALPYVMDAHLVPVPLSAIVLGLLFTMIVRDALRAHAPAPRAVAGGVGAPRIVQERTLLSRA
jgi:alpha-1,2-mannosyltransferase